MSSRILVVGEDECDGEYWPESIKPEIINLNDNPKFKTEILPRDRRTERLGSFGGIIGDNIIMGGGQSSGNYCNDYFVVGHPGSKALIEPRWFAGNHTLLRVIAKSLKNR